MKWLLFFFTLELGWMPHGEFVMYDAPLLFESFPVAYTAYAELEAEVELFGIFFAGGSIRTSVWQLQHSSWTFFPHKAVYGFFAGARWKLLELGFRHFCIHPVVPYFGLIQPEALWEGAYDELYLRISNR